MSGPRPLIAAAFRHAAVPLGAYYAVTVALPLANGAASAGSRFAVHAVMVLVVPPAAIVLACGFYAMARAVRRHFSAKELHHYHQPCPSRSASASST